MGKMLMREFSHPFYVNENVVRTFTSSFSVSKNKHTKGLDLLPLLDRIQRVSGSTVVTAANHVAPFVKSAKPYEAVITDVITFEIDNNKLTEDFIIYTCFLNSTNADSRINRLLMVNDEDLEFLQHICSCVVS